MTGSDELITGMLDNLSNGRESIEGQIADLVFHMPGGTPHHEWRLMSFLDRDRYIHMLNAQAKVKTGKEYF